MNVISGKSFENSWKRERICRNLKPLETVCAQLCFLPQTIPQPNQVIIYQKRKINQKEHIKTLK